MRRLAAACCIAASFIVDGFTQPARPAFDVASIKANRSGERASHGETVGGRFSLTNVTVQQLLVSAFAVTDPQIIGGPSWITTARFDITAKLPPGSYDAQTGVALSRVVSPMLQTLLEDRFHLTFHRETREVSEVSIMLARADGRLGPRMTAASADDADCAKDRGTDFDFSDPFKTVERCSSTGGPSKSGGRRLVGRGMTMDVLAQRLAGQLGRGGLIPVRNDTGLSGAFNFDLEYLPDGLDPGTAPDLASIYTAVQEQLGLKLVTKDVAGLVIVIDHVERPTED